MAAQYALYAFMLLMLIMGTINILLLKFQHMQTVPMSPGGPAVNFDHPWLQAALMMVGEFLCLPVYYLTRTREAAEESGRVPKWIFLVPCCCDLTATALLCMGIALIAVSVAQMCRGTIVVFACAMSVVFLGRRQKCFQIIGVVIVMIGIFFVSLSQLIDPQTGAVSAMPKHMIMGISLCIFAQVFQASMFVYEEKIMSQYVVQPLQVVGMEGLFGIFISVILLVTLQLLGYANTPGAWHQISNSPLLAISMVASMLAVAVFNFAGATVTQKSSAVARTTIKISSTILIWMAELALGWNRFSIVQLFGFVFVAVGTVVYNRLVVIPFLDSPDEMKPIISEKEKDAASKA